jgi:phospholysine phosphohistidine inorganic pyrophosphate phosphatase
VSPHCLDPAPRGLLLDLDGTVYEDDRPVPGAADAIARLRERGVPIRFVTNTTRASRSTIAGWLARAGVTAEDDDIFTPSRTAATWLQAQALRRVALALPGEAFSDFLGLEIVREAPEAVVVGDLGSGWTFDVMNQVFRWVLDGAALVALHRNRYWKTGGQLVLDVGAFVAAFEYATGKEATLAGKPSRAMFEAAARDMELDLDDVAMVGDDVQTDVAGSRALGIPAILVRTGKFDAAAIEATTSEPTLVIDSVAALPDVVLP